MKTLVAPAARRLLLPLLLTILLPATRAGFCTSSDPDDPKPGWRNGPPRLLLTSEEEKAYKALKTDEERAKAIQEFWALRDPTPGTPVNEFRNDFYKRVEEANGQFRETGLGWLTDRGRMLLVAGYPDERIGAGEEKETWKYQRGFPPGPGKPLKTYTVTFVRNEAGEYRMDSVGGDLLNEVRKLPAGDAARASMPAKVSGAGGASPAARGSGAAAQPPGTPPAGGGKPALAALPAEIQRLREAARTGGTSDLAIETSARYYMAEDKSTNAILVFAVRKADMSTGADGKPPTLLYASITPAGPDPIPIEIVNQEGFILQEDAREGMFKYARWITLKPGAYELRVAASDGPAGRIGVKTLALNLPDFSGDALALSSVTLASIAEPAPADLGAKSPWQFGKLRLVPRLTPVLGPGEDLSFFYRVYNSRRDASGKPTLDVTYTVEKKEGSGWVKKLRNPLVLPEQHVEELGYTIPADMLARWPAGDWRVGILVHDRIAATDAATTVEFSKK